MSTSTSPSLEAIVRNVYDVQDVTGLRALVQAHAAFERSSVTLGTDWDARVQERIREGRLWVLVAETDGQAIGYATLTHELSTWTARPYGHLDCLYVDADHRGAGLGHALVRIVLEHAREQGLVEAQWQTPSWNAPAITFYEALGARHVTKQRFTLRTKEDKPAQRTDNT